MIRYLGFKRVMSDEIDSGVLCGKIKKTEPLHLWYYARIPLNCLSLQLKETICSLWPGETGACITVHQMSKEEDCPQEQK